MSFCDSIALSLLKREFITTFQFYKTVANVNIIFFLRINCIKEKIVENEIN